MIQVTVQEATGQKQVTGTSVEFYEEGVLVVNQILEAGKVVDAGSVRIAIDDIVRITSI